MKQKYKIMGCIIACIFLLLMINNKVEAASYPSSGEPPFRADNRWYYCREPGHNLWSWTGGPITYFNAGPTYGLPTYMAYANQMAFKYHTEGNASRIVQLMVWADGYLANRDVFQVNYSGYWNQANGSPNYPYGDPYNIVHEEISYDQYNAACALKTEADNYQNNVYPKLSNYQASANKTQAKATRLADGRFKVGPFSNNYYKASYEKEQYAYTKEMYLTDHNGNRININQYEVNGVVYNNFDNINSGTEFYVIVSDSNIKKAKTVRLNTTFEYKIYSGNFTIYYPDPGSYPWYVHNTSVDAQDVETLSSRVETKTKTVYSDPVAMLIDLGGSVFEDKVTGKSNPPNGILDSNDGLLNGIEVVLYKKDGTEIAHMDTKNINGQNGRFEFKEVSAVEDYYVRFKYDGQNYEPTTYQTLKKGLPGATPTIDTTAQERSYATDGRNTRKTFNNQYAEIAGQVATTREIYAYTGPNGLESNTKYFSINNSETELASINFGIMKREAFDLRLTKDLYSVQTKINGKDHTYQYNGREKEDMNLNIPPEDMIQVGDTMIYPNDTRGTNHSPYTREIRKSDLDYKADNSSEELKVYATYMIRLYNQSNGLIDGKTTQLIDWYDKGYTYLEGESKNHKGTVISWTQTTSDQAELKKMSTQMEGLTIGAGESEYIYVTYEVDTNDLKNKDIGTEAKKQNYAEIGAYKTTYSEQKKDLNGTYIMHEKGEVAGLIDKDSVPNNFEFSKANYEDDVDKAPTLNIRVAQNRTLDGSAWEETPDAKKLREENLRLGNGQKEDEEYKIKGETVELVEYDADGKEKKVVQTTKTNADGSYGFTGYIPGNYRVRFRYGEGSTLDPKENGGKIFSGQDYKSTLFVDPEKRNIGDINQDTKTDLVDLQLLLKQINGTEELSAQQKKIADLNADEKIDQTDMTILTQLVEKKETITQYWYLVVDNQSDALDNLERREAVNGYSKELTNYKAEVLNSGKGQAELAVETQMDASTPMMDVEIEYGRSKTPYTEAQNVAYAIREVNFGIIERPRSELVIQKKVTNFKLTTADGQTLFDSKSRAPNLAWTNEHIQATVDDNLMHGSTLTLTYDFEIQNTGEVDYVDTATKKVDEAFYKTGIPSSGAQIVQTTPKNILDYVANNINFNSGLNPKWEIIDITQVQKGTKDIPNKDSLVSDQITNVGTYNTIIQAKAGQNELLNALLPWRKGTSGKNETGTKTELKNGLTLSKVISSQSDQDDLTYQNYIEIVRLTNQAGRRSYQESDGQKHISIPGNLDPVTEVGLEESDANNAQEVIILPPYGENKMQMVYYIIGAITLGILAIGSIAVIKKKVLGNHHKK